MDPISLSILWGVKILVGKAVTAAMAKTAVGVGIKTIAACSAKTAVGVGGKAVILKTGLSTYVQHKAVEKALEVAAKTSFAQDHDELINATQSWERSLSEKVVTKKEIAKEIRGEFRSECISTALELVDAKGKSTVKMSKVYDRLDYTKDVGCYLYDTTKQIRSLKHCS